MKSAINNYNCTITFLTCYSESFGNSHKRLELIISTLYPQCSHIAINLDEKYSGINYSEKNKFGYFIFKPEIILEVISGLREGDIIIYIDSNDLPKAGLVEYVHDQLNYTKYDLIVSSTNYLQRKMRHCLGRRVFSPFFYFYSGLKIQPEAGCIAVKKTANLIYKLKQWYHITSAIAQLNDEQKDSRSRHDQEALTYVLVQTNFNKIESWFCNKFTNKPNLRRFIDFEGNRD